MNYPRSYIVLHHTGAEEKDAAQVKRYHLGLGWRDVGYNYIIERDGRVVAGRPLDIPGAHCKAGGMNLKSIGIALIGNFEVHPPTDAQTTALVALVRTLQTRHGIAAERILPHGRVPGAKTACPGRYFPLGELLARLADPGFAWKVQCGAFSTRQAAESCALRLQKKGISCFVVGDGIISSP